MAERKWTHGLTDGMSVETLDHGRGHRSREVGTVNFLGRVGFTTYQHPNTVYWFLDQGLTWRYWAGRGREGGKGQR